jgi:ribosome-binding factor A
MPREFSRTRRVEEQLRRDLAELIRHEIKEPGLGITSISEIKVSPDLAVAQVYISIMQDDHELIDYTMHTLQDYSGKLRGLLGKRMRIRRVPQLNFIYDDLIQKGNKLDKAIEKAVEEDRQKADQFHTDQANEEGDNG